MIDSDEEGVERWCDSRRLSIHRGETFCRTRASNLFLIKTVRSGNARESKQSRRRHVNNKQARQLTCISPMFTFCRLVHTDLLHCVQTSQPAYRCRHSADRPRVVSSQISCIYIFLMKNYHKQDSARSGLTDLRKI